MAIQHPVSIPVLRQLLRLDSETGKLYWRKRGVEWFTDGKQSAAHRCAIWNGRFAGKEALTALSAGYRTGDIFGRSYRAHRVVFALATGRWPDSEVDHRDGDPANNRPENLREATSAENKRNTGARGGSSRYCGVSWCKQESKWRATCKDVTGRTRQLGRFSEEIEAALARDNFARREHGAFARLNFPSSPNA